ncbi:MAG: hypothetical protein MK110_14270 [Fuerstiella sp.]|nr:hypothetical protein [Fuerstiella sp.]
MSHLGDTEKETGLFVGLANIYLSTITAELPSNKSLYLAIQIQWKALAISIAADLDQNPYE